MPLQFFVKCAKCGRYQPSPTQDRFIPNTPDGWIGLHVQPELTVSSDFLGFICEGCKSDVLGAIIALLPYAGERK